MSHSTPTTEIETTISNATAFVRSYGSAIALTQYSNSTPETVAKALVRHYAPAFTAHDHGHSVTAPSNGTLFWLNGVTVHLKRFQKSGLGWNMSLTDFRIKVVDEATLDCHVTWAIEPKGREGWSWTNVYTWRDGGEVGEDDGLKGAFVSVVSDEETEELFKRVPGWMEIEV